jgi:hypothetical protein
VDGCRRHDTWDALICYFMLLRLLVLCSRVPSLGSDSGLVASGSINSVTSRSTRYSMSAAGYLSTLNI